MNRRFFRFHLVTLIVAVWTCGALMAVQFYRDRAAFLDKPLEMFANPAKSPNPIGAHSEYFGTYEDWKSPSPEILAARERHKAELEQLKFEIKWHNLPFIGFLLPREWMVGIGVPLLAALITEYIARRRDNRKQIAPETESNPPNA